MVMGTHQGPTDPTMWMRILHVPLGLCKGGPNPGDNCVGSMHKAMFKGKNTTCHITLNIQTQYLAV